MFAKLTTAASQRQRRCGNIPPPRTEEIELSLLQNGLAVDPSEEAVEVESLPSPQGAVVSASIRLQIAYVFQVLKDGAISIWRRVNPARRSPCFDMTSFPDSVYLRRDLIESPIIRSPSRWSPRPQQLLEEDMLLRSFLTHVTSDRTS